MKQLLFCFLLFISLDVFAQKASITTAFDRYKVGDYNGAIKLYREDLKQALRPSTSLYIYSMIGECYVKLDSPQLTKQAFLTSLNVTTKVEFFDKLSIFHSANYLAGIYLKEKSYRAALNYYRLSIDTLKKIGGEIWEYVPQLFAFSNSANQAKCYLGLGAIDSAIAVMSSQMLITPLSETEIGYPIYSKAEAVYRDSIFRFYISVLQRKYSNRQIKKDFKKAEESFEFTEKTDPELHGYVFKFFTASVKIYGQEIVVHSRGYGLPKEKWLLSKPEVYQTKDFQLEEFHNSSLSKIIRDLPD